MEATDINVYSLSFDNHQPVAVLELFQVFIRHHVPFIQVNKQIEIWLLRSETMSITALKTASGASPEQKCSETHHSTHRFIILQQTFLTDKCSGSIIHVIITPVIFLLWQNKIYPVRKVKQLEKKSSPCAVCSPHYLWMTSLFRSVLLPNWGITRWLRWSFLFTITFNSPFTLSNKRTSQYLDTLSG